MAIEISREVRQQAIASIERYFLETSGEKIGNIAAGGLLTFFLEEIGPVVYNQAVHHVQERITTRVSELDIEVHEDEFHYWRNVDSKKSTNWCICCRMHNAWTIPWMYFSTSYVDVAVCANTG